MSLVSSDDLLNLDGISQRQSWWRVDVLGLDFTWQETIQPTGALTITLDTTRQTMRSLSGFVMPPDLGAEFTETGVLIQPRLVLENGDSKAMGTFRFVDARRVRDSTGVQFEGTLGDLSVQVDVQSATTISIQKGTYITSAITDLLVSRGITRYSVAVTGVQAGSDIAYPAGTSILKIIGDLAAMMGCLPLAFTAEGVAVVAPPPTLLGTVTADVSYSDGLNIFDTGIAEWNDVLTAPNLFIVIESGATTGAIVGQYALPPTAPNSSAVLGYDNPVVITQQGLPDTAAANDAAKVAAFTQGVVFDHRTFDGPTDWRHEPFAIVGFRGDVFVEQGWTASSVIGANMNHTLKKVYV